MVDRYLTNVEELQVAVYADWSRNGYCRFCHRRQRSTDGETHNTECPRAIYITDHYAVVPQRSDSEHVFFLGHEFRGRGWYTNRQEYEEIKRQTGCLA